MSKEQIIVGLDVGTCFTRTVVAKPAEQRPQIIGVGRAPSFGLRHGFIVDMEEAVKGVRQSVEEAERSSGFPIERVYVGLGGSHVACRISKGVVAVARADAEITKEDVDRVIAAASAVSVSQNREIVHVLPRSFSVDNQTNIKNPVGMKGIRLEAETLVIEGSTPHLRSLHNCLNEAGLEVKETVLAPLAASRAALSKRQKELGVLSVDLGGGTAGLTVFEEGDIIHSCILPIGSSNITNDIAIGLRSDIDLAEKIKLEYGTVLISEIGKRDAIDLSKLNPEEKDIIPRVQVAEIIEARLDEIMDLINKELKAIDRQGLLPAGVVLLGGGAKMPGLVDLVKSKLKLPAQIGFPLELDGIAQEVDDPSFSVAVGLVLWGMDEQSKRKEYAFSFGSINPTFNKIKSWLKDFLP